MANPSLPPAPLSFFLYFLLKCQTLKVLMLVRERRRMELNLRLHQPAMLHKKKKKNFG